MTPGFANATRRLLVRSGLLACLAALTGCLAPAPRFGSWPAEPESRPVWRLAPRTEQPPAGSAWLTVASIAVSPQTVHSGEPFEIRLRVRNDGKRTSGAFRTELQANLEGESGVVSYPIASKARRELAPGASAEFAITWADGLPRRGVYSIVGGIQIIDLALVESTDYVNPQMPAVRLVVE